MGNYKILNVPNLIFTVICSLKKRGQVVFSSIGNSSLQNCLCDCYIWEIFIKIIIEPNMTFTWDYSLKKREQKQVVLVLCSYLVIATFETGITKNDIFWTK